MKICYIILLVFSMGCYKKNEDIEAIPVQGISFKTTLKNHTPGIDYTINQSIDVGKELIIEPGVEIMVQEGCAITVSGEGFINAAGNAGQPIVFKQKSQGGRWKGIIVSSSAESLLSHVELSGAGSAGDNHGAIEVDALSKLKLSDCKISDNGSASAVMVAENAVCNISNCEFSKNNFPLQMDLHAVLTLGAGNRFDNNDNKVIRVCNHDNSPLLTQKNLQLPDRGLPYFFTSWLVVSQYTVTINSGVTLLFEAGSGIRTSNNAMDMTAALLVNGSSGSPVTLNSFRAGANERWGGISLSNGISRIQYAILKKTNSTDKSLALLNVYGHATLECRYSTFYTDKAFCNISLIGSYISVNADIFTRNTFVNALLPCVIL